MKVITGLLAGLVLLAGFAAAGTAVWLGPLASTIDHVEHASRTGAFAPSSGPSEGSSPSATDALTRLERLGSIQIKSREGFHPEHGVRSGSGTPADPYVFEGFYAERMSIEDVEASYIIRDVYIAGTLRLDYTGATARVERSTIGSFLTDTNRAHEAPHTWLDVRDNHFGAARIRHAGGIFTGNVVGAPGAIDPERLALEVQGYNGLVVANNVVHGAVEFRLHGHHYSPSYAEAWKPMEGHDHGDPAVRYHEVRVEGNDFRDASGRGVALSDRDHAGNHATAASAPDPRLNEAHQHLLRFHFEKNRMSGAGLVIERPNAPDAKHTGGEAWIFARANTIIDPLGGVGIEVRGARGANVELADNVIRNTVGRVAGSVGVLLQKAEGGSLIVRGGEISGFEQGVRAKDLKAGTEWTVEGVATHDVGRAIHWDRSVKTAPKGTSGAIDPRSIPSPHAHHGG